jgi:RHS repeat-associated protein
LITREDGVWVKRYAYDPWGRLLSQQSRPGYESLSCPFTYRGYYHDSETSLYYLRARYYSPSLRRFLTRDPHPGRKTDPQTLNPYQYCVNNPLRFIDPSGLWLVEEGYGKSYWVDRSSNLRHQTQYNTASYMRKRQEIVLANAEKGFPPVIYPVGVKGAVKNLLGFGLRNSNSIGRGLAVIGFLTGQPYLMELGLVLPGVGTGRSIYNAYQLKSRIRFQIQIM